MKRTDASFTGERRLLYMTPPGDPERPQPPANLNRLNNLHMREDEETWKNRYAYDTVQKRVADYQAHVERLHTQLGERRTSAQRREDIGTIRLPLEYRDGEERERSDRGYYFVESRRNPGWVFWRNPNTNVVSGTRDGLTWEEYPYPPEGLLYASDVYNSYNDASSRRNRIDSYQHMFRFGREFRTYSQADIDRMTKGEEAVSRRMTRMFWSVEQLERHYGRVEQLIADLDRQAGTPGAETLQQQMLGQRMATLRQQMEATSDSDKLQTIHIDLYNRPFTNIENRTYYLLRLPQGVRPVFVEGDRERQIGRIITLSGSAQYLQLDSTGNINERTMRLRLYGVGSAPADASITRNEFNNLIFTFERPRENPEIDVNRITPMYTGEGRRFDLQTTGDALERTSIVLPGEGPGNEIWKFGDGAKEVRPQGPDGLVLRIDARGNVDVTGGAMKTDGPMPINFVRKNPNGTPAQTEEREIVVQEIDVTPRRHVFTHGETESGMEKEFAIQPPDQTATAKVFFPDQTTELVPGASVEHEGVTITRYANGGIFAHGMRPTTAPVQLWVGHGTQALIPCEVVVQPPPPEMQQFQKTLSENQQIELRQALDKGAEERRAKAEQAAKVKAQEEARKRRMDLNPPLEEEPPVPAEPPAAPSAPAPEAPIGADAPPEEPEVIETPEDNEASPVSIEEPSPPAVETPVQPPSQSEPQPEVPQPQPQNEPVPPQEQPVMEAQVIAPEPPQSEPEQMPPAPAETVNTPLAVTPEENPTQTPSATPTNTPPQDIDQSAALNTEAASGDRPATQKAGFLEWLSRLFQAFRRTPRNARPGQRPQP